MGMAAGQARFLGLTARKTNVEYEGQQINQQRTALSNQSATYNNQLLGLNVPTAPSVESFTKTTYSWSAIGGTETNTINNIVPNNAAGPNQFDITYTTTGAATEGYDSKSTGSVTVKQVQTPIADAAGKLFGDPAWVPTYSSAFNYSIGSGANNGLVLASTSEQATLQAAWKKDPNNIGAAPNFYKFTDQNNATTYYSEAQMQANLASSIPAPVVTTDPVTGVKTTTGTPNNIEIYKSGNHATSISGIKATATINVDSGGRLTDISIGGNTYKLNTNTTTDEAGYNDAMNKYAYDKDQYNKVLNDINTKIAIIQQQDKTLELKLKQCDTEQQAISTEMDAVKKVIDKNVEATFKTFG